MAVPDSLVVTQLPSTTLDPQTPHYHFSSPISAGEQFPTPSSTSSEGTPSTSSHQSPGLSHGISRVGPHGPNYCHAVHAPARNKQHKQAQDVQTFFTEEEGLYVCLFCTSVSCCLACFIFSEMFIGRSMHLTHNIWLHSMGKRPAPPFAKVTCVNHIQVHGLLPVINLALISWPRVHRTLFRNIKCSWSRGSLRALYAWSLCWRNCWLYSLWWSGTSKVIFCIHFVNLYIVVRVLMSLSLWSYEPFFWCCEKILRTLTFHITLQFANRSWKYGKNILISCKIKIR